MYGLVWNDGFFAGEFTKVFYRLDTDYDSVIMDHVLAGKHPDWKTEDSMHGRYHGDTIFVGLVLSEYRMLNEDELEQVWHHHGEEKSIVKVPQTQNQGNYVLKAAGAKSSGTIPRHHIVSGRRKCV